MAVPKKSSNKNMSFQRFILRAVGAYILWVILFFFWGKGPNGFDQAMTNITGSTIITALQSLHYNIDGTWETIPASQWDDVAHTGLVLSIDGAKIVSISNRCNALFTIAIYIAFILIYPSSNLISKALFIIAGALILWVVNMVRIVALLLNYQWHIQSFDFNHKYTFAFLLYAIVFAIWMYWLNNYAQRVPSHLSKS